MPDKFLKNEKENMEYRTILYTIDEPEKIVYIAHIYYGGMVDYILLTLNGNIAYIIFKKNT